MSKHFKSLVQLNLDSVRGQIQKKRDEELEATGEEALKWMRKTLQIEDLNLQEVLKPNCWFLIELTNILKPTINVQYILTKLTSKQIHENLHHFRKTLVKDFGYEDSNRFETTEILNDPEQGKRKLLETAIFLFDWSIKHGSERSYSKQPRKVYVIEEDLLKRAPISKELNERLKSIDLETTEFQKRSFTIENQKFELLDKKNKNKNNEKEKSNTDSDSNKDSNSSSENDSDLKNKEKSNSKSDSGFDSNSKSSSDSDSDSNSNSNSNSNSEKGSDFKDKDKDEDEFQEKLILKSNSRSEKDSKSSSDSNSNTDNKDSNVSSGNDNEDKKGGSLSENNNSESESESESEDDLEDDLEEDLEEEEEGEQRNKRKKIKILASNQVHDTIKRNFVFKKDSKPNSNSDSGSGSGFGSGSGSGSNSNSNSGTNSEKDSDLKNKDKIQEKSISKSNSGSDKDSKSSSDSNSNTDKKDSNVSSGNDNEDKKGGSLSENDNSESESESESEDDLEDDLEEGLEEGEEGEQRNKRKKIKILASNQVHDTIKRNFASKKDSKTSSNSNSNSNSNSDKDSNSGKDSNSNSEKDSNSGTNSEKDSDLKNKDKIQEKSILQSNSGLDKDSKSNSDSNSNTDDKDSNKSSGNDNEDKKGGSLSENDNSESESQSEDDLKEGLEGEEGEQRNKRKKIKVLASNQVNDTIKPNFVSKKDSKTSSNSNSGSGSGSGSRSGFNSNSEKDSNSNSNSEKDSDLQNKDKIQEKSKSGSDKDSKTSFSSSSDSNSHSDSDKSSDLENKDKIKEKTVIKTKSSSDKDSKFSSDSNSNAHSDSEKYSGLKNKINEKEKEQEQSEPESDTGSVFTSEMSSNSEFILEDDLERLQEEYKKIKLRNIEARNKNKKLLQKNRILDTEYQKIKKENGWSDDSSLDSYNEEFNYRDRNDIRSINSNISSNSSDSKDSFRNQKRGGRDGYHDKELMRDKKNKREAFDSNEENLEDSNNSDFEKYPTKLTKGRERSTQDRYKTIQYDMPTKNMKRGKERTGKRNGRGARSGKGKRRKGSEKQKENRTTGHDYVITSYSEFIQCVRNSYEEVYPNTKLDHLKTTRVNKKFLLELIENDKLGFELLIIINKLYDWVNLSKKDLDPKKIYSGKVRKDKELVSQNIKSMRSKIRRYDRAYEDTHKILHLGRSFQVFDIDNSNTGIYRVGKVWVEKSQIKVTIDGVGEVFKANYNSPITILIDKFHPRKFMLIDQTTEKQIIIRSENVSLRRIYLFLLIKLFSTQGKSVLFGKKQKKYQEHFEMLVKSGQKLPRPSTPKKKLQGKFDLSLLPPLMKPAEHDKKFLITSDYLQEQVVDGSKTALEIQYNNYQGVCKMLFLIHIHDRNSELLFQSGYLQVLQNEIRYKIQRKKYLPISFKQSWQIRQNQKQPRIIEICKIINNNNNKKKKKKKLIPIIYFSASNQLLAKFIVSSVEYFQNKFFQNMKKNGKNKRKKKLK
ncbi:af4/fmr2 family member [Anaeramoeba flamelloides]|uniref:Af4/fmr2 family member n=1 Tax=Anaeramoeba flamelloides TaxID=1746091 RepID=A0ABQ8X7H0_9EUKA|nr:af4/fmr2 family member [Anaeramoeba flamelloides]